MMAARKKKSEDKNTDTLGSTRSMRADAEEKIALSKKSSSDLKGQTPEKLIHELQVHQIELETQAEELRRAHLALEESRDKYLDLYDFAPVGYLTLTDKELITEVNLTGATLLGAERSKLVKARFKKFVAPQDHFGWNRYFASVLKNEKKLSTTLVLIKGDGSTFTARLESIRLTGNSESPTTVRVAISDITDIWQLETLRESEERFRTILHAMQFGIVIIDAQTHTILDANHQALEMIGGSNDDVIGKVCHHFICPAEYGRCPVTDLGQICDSCESFLFNLRGKKRFILKSVIKTSLGGKDVLIESFVDITERKQMEEALHESEKNYHSIFDNAVMGIYQVSKEGQFLSANNHAARILGYESAEELIQSITDIDTQIYRDPETREEAKRILRETGVLENFEVPCRHKDGHTVWVSFNARLVRDAESNVLYHEGTSQDITERKVAELELVFAQESLKEAHHLAHIGTWDWIMETDTVTWSEELYNIAGRDSSLPAPTYAEHPHVYTPASWERLSAAVTNALNTGEPYNLELELVRKDGSLRWVNAFGGVKRDGEGKVIGLHGTVQDITERKRAEEALRQSEERYRAIYDQSPIAIELYDASGTLVHVNPACLNLFGIKDIQAIQNFSLFADPNISDEQKERLRQGETIQYEGPFDFEKVKTLNLYPTLREGIIWLDVLITPLGNHADSITGFLVQIKDITKRKRAEEMVRESENRYRTLIENMPDGIILHSPSGKILYANNSVASLLHLQDPGVLRGKNVLDFVDPDYRDKVSARMKDVVKKGEPIPLQEEVLICSDGTRVTVENQGCRVLFHGEYATQVVVRDITERKRAEEKLRVSEQKYRDIFENSVIGLFQTAPGDRIIKVNNAFARMYGFSDAAELLATNSEVGSPPYANREDRQEVLRILVQKGKVENYETLHCKRDGTRFWVSITAQTIRDNEGNVLLYEGTIIDITERKQADEKLVATLKRTQDQQAALGEISFSPHLFSGDVHGLSARLTEVSSAVLGVERASVWLFNNNEDELRCIDLYEVLYDRHSYDSVLKRREYVNEFDALRTAKYIDADDPLTDPRTTGYVKGYLKPNRITSMLDAVIRVSGQNLGVLCFEHVDRSHHWETDEIAFACQLADQIAITLLNRDRKRAEEALLKKAEELDNKNRLFSTLLDTVPIGVFMVEAQSGKPILSNREATRLLGRGILPDTTEANLAEVYEAYKIGTSGRYPTTEMPIVRGMQGESSHIDDMVIVRPDSTRTTLEIFGNPVFDSQDHIIASLVCFLDITERKRDEEILRESEARFRKILEMAPLPLCYVNVNGVITFRNERFVQIFGYTADDVPTLAEWWQRAYPDAHYRQWVTTKWDVAVKRAIEDGTDIEPIEYTVTCKSGEERIIEISGITLGEDFLATFIDLTERKRAEVAFRQLSADHKVIIDHAPAMVWYKDTKNNFIRVNPAGAQAFGLSIEEIEGNSTYDLFPDFAEKYYQDDLDVINSGKPRLGIIEPMTTASGEHRWVQTDKIPLRDEQGTITGILVFSVDITGRKRTEDALQVSELQYRRLFETAQEGILIFDEGTGTIIDANQFLIDMLGYPQEYFVGKHLWEVGFIKDKTLAQHAFTELKTNGYIRYEDLPLETIDGRSIDVEFISNVYSVNNHKIIQCNIRDITARKKAEEALALASKKLALLSGITRHDINNQLTILLGYLTILKKKQPDPAFDEYFVKVSTAAQRISSMIQFTREYENIGVHAPVWQDCRSLVDTAAKEAPLGKIIVKNDIPAGADVFADPLIVKVFYNLMDNAVRYGGKITTIRFSAEEAGDDHVIICEDDGDGVVAEEKEKIFERGFGKNTGLGLALSREILDITGITIKETGEPGKGARFEIMVPKGAWRRAGEDN